MSKAKDILRAQQGKSIRHENVILTRFGLLPDKRIESPRYIKCYLCGGSKGTLIATEKGYKHQDCKK